MTPTGVLVITQDTWLAESVRSTLPGPEFETHLAGRATGAVELARRLRPDVVVIDLELRTVDAAEVCRALVERFDAPVLGLASSDPGARVAFLSAGGHGCVRKPMNHSELEALIRAHASRKEDAPRPAILRCGRRFCAAAGDSALRRAGNRPGGHGSQAGWPASTPDTDGVPAAGRSGRAPGRGADVRGPADGRVGNQIRRRPHDSVPCGESPREVGAERRGPFTDTGCARRGLQARVHPGKPTGISGETLTESRANPVRFLGKPRARAVYG